MQLDLNFLNSSDIKRKQEVLHWNEFVIISSLCHLDTNFVFRRPHISYTEHGLLLFGRYFVDFVVVVIFQFFKKFKERYYHVYILLHSVKLLNVARAL
jgi:hypothetical protein